MSTIKWSPTSANLRGGQSSTTIVVGSPGSGKTFSLINMCANCLGMGQKIIAIDPKNDLDKLYNVNPNVNIIDVNNIRPGALNPFEFLKNIDENGKVKYVDASIIMTVIEIMCGKLDKKEFQAITPIIKDFVKDNENNNKYVDMYDLANYLYSRQNESAQHIGISLKLHEKSTYGKLLFTTEENVKPLVLSPTDSMIISLLGMSLPGYSTKAEDYTSEERLTSAIIYIITHKLSSILSSDSKIPTTFVCDEAFLLFSNKEMAAVIDNFMRLGRSLNVSVILASQGISHFPKGIANYVTSKFMFRSSADEAAAFIDTFDTSNLDGSNAIDRNSLIASATQFDTGVCWFSDHAGRNGIIRIKSIYDEKLLTSNPFDKDRSKKG